jgi:hypothetical protein
MVPELVEAPELAVVILLEHALDVVREALLAAHPTLIDELRIPREDGTVVTTANTICLRAMALRDTLRRYRGAVRDAAGVRERERDVDDDLTF